MNNTATVPADIQHQSGRKSRAAHPRNNIHKAPPVNDMTRLRGWVNHGFFCDFSKQRIENNLKEKLPLKKKWKFFSALVFIRALKKSDSKKELGFF